MTITKTKSNVTPKGAKFRTVKTKGRKTLASKNHKKRKSVAEKKEEEPAKPTYMLEVIDADNQLVWVTQTSAPISYRKPLREMPKRKCKVSNVMIVKKEIFMKKILSIDKCVTKNNYSYNPMKVTVCGNKWKMVIKPQPKHIKGEFGYNYLKDASYHAANNANFYLENGCKVKDREAMNAFDNERFEWIEERKQVDETSISTATVNTKTVHDKWVLCEYKYPIYQYKKSLAEGNRQMDDHVVRHISIRKSNIDGAGSGLFAERTFRLNDTITSYRGRNVTKVGEKNNYCVDIVKDIKNSKCKVKALQANPDLLYLGAHFANDREHGCRSVAERKAFRKNRMKRQNNAWFNGIKICCGVSTIFVDQEITLSYNISLPETYSVDDKPKK